MCGVCGIVDYSGRSLDVDVIRKMNESQFHRGPDHGDVWVNEEQSVAFGHQRLSIIDLSQAANQPMESENGRFIITFNGEIYNYKELRIELERDGYSFKSNSDTEVLLISFMHWGTDCLRRLDGMFAFAIWDKKKQELFCARDRFGEKPFYFYHDEKQFIFASEIKALKACGISLRSDQKKIYQYLLYGTIYDVNDPSGTFYSNVKCLEQGCYLLLNQEGLYQKERYWELDLNKRSTLSETDSIEKFSDLLTKSVRLRLRSDANYGASLSGGLDSSSLVALISNIEKKELNVFSARFKDFKKDEGPYIEKMISSFSNLVSNQVFCDKTDFERSFEKVVKYQDEPFGSLSIVAQYQVMKLAQEKGVKVLLDGQGADEFLAGYTMFFSSYYAQLYSKNRQRFNNEVLAFESLYGSKWKQVNYSLFERVKTRSEKAYQFFAGINRSFKKPDDAYFLGINPEIVREYRNTKNPIYKPFDLKSHLFSSTTQKGLSELLRYSDRNSMANSIEVRLPFLSHELVEFVFTLPENFLIRDAWTKYVLRRSMSDLLPDMICWRKDKIGFEPPQNEILKASFFKDKINDAEAKLLKDGIIKEVKNELSWSYLMLNEYLS